MSTLAEIKVRAAEPEKVLEWSNPYSDEYISALQASQADNLKLIAALEAAQALAAEHAARKAFTDASKIYSAYSLGKQHGYDRMLFEIAEALA